MAQFKVNRELSQALEPAGQRMDLVASQRQADQPDAAGAYRFKYAARTVAMAAGSSNLLGEALRYANQPVCRKRRNRSSWIPRWRSYPCSVLRYEDLLSSQPQLRLIRQADGEPLTSEQTAFWRRSCARLSCSIRLLGAAIRLFWN